MNDSNKTTVSGACCPSCSSANVQSTLVDTSFLYGQGQSAVLLEVQLHAYECMDCGLEYVDDSAEDLKHQAVCRHLGVFAPAEVAAIRNSTGMSRANFAQLTKIGEATLGRWERGALIQNASHDQFLYLLTFPDNVVRLLNRQRPQSPDLQRTELRSERMQRKFRSLDKKRLDAAIESAASFRLHNPKAA